MASRVKCLLLIFSYIVVLTRADDRVHFFNDEHEKRWNTPPELTPEQVTRKKAETINGRADARFLPFSASFNINAGQDNSEALQLGAGLGGISVSQSSSFSQAAANSFGNIGSSLSASQSSSFAAGLTGVSASDANSFNVNHPVFGGQSNSDSNSFSVGQASASSQANAQNGQASSQASIGSVHSSSASSGNNVQVLSDGLILGQPQGVRKPIWTNIGPNHDFPDHPISNRPTLIIQEAPITNEKKRPITLTLGSYDSRQQQSRPQLETNEWHPNGGANFQGHHQWRPHSKHEYAQGYPSIPNSWSQGQGQSSGGLHIAVGPANSGASSNSGAHAQGLVTSVHRNPYGRIKGNFANVNSMNQGGPSVDFVKFPEQTHIQSIPREFVRSKQTFDGKHLSEEKDLVEDIVSDIADTVSDLLNIS